MKMWDLDDLITTREAAALLGQKSASVSNYKSRYAGFPEPKFDRGGSVLYSRTEVIDWFSKRLPPEMILALRDRWK